MERYHGVWYVVLEFIPIKLRSNSPSFQVTVSTTSFSYHSDLTDVGAKLPLSLFCSNSKLDALGALLLSF